MNIAIKKQLVLLAINNNQDAADFDEVLMAECWSVELAEKGINITPAQLWNILRHVSRADTLTRRRRELFNEGKIKYSEKASKRRMTAYAAEKEMHSSYVPGNVYGH